MYKMTPEMRTPPVIRTLQAVPRVSAIEGFHCILVLVETQLSDSAVLCFDNVLLGTSWVKKDAMFTSGTCIIITHMHYNEYMKLLVYILRPTWQPSKFIIATCTCYVS